MHKTSKLQTWLIWRRWANQATLTEIIQKSSNNGKTRILFFKFFNLKSQKKTA